MAAHLKSCEIFKVGRGSAGSLTSLRLLLQQKKKRAEEEVIKAEGDRRKVDGEKEKKKKRRMNGWFGFCVV